MRVNSQAIKAPVTLAVNAYLCLGIYCIESIERTINGSRVFRVGPGFGPNFRKRNRAQSGSIESTLANNFFFIRTYFLKLDKLLEKCWQRSALALSRNATFPPAD